MLKKNGTIAPAQRGLINVNSHNNNIESIEDIKFTRITRV